MAAGKMKRPEMLKLIKAAGLDLQTLCRMEGELVAQPTWQFLANVVEKYGLAEKPTAKKGPVAAKEFFKPSSGKVVVQEASVSNVAESPEMLGMQEPSIGNVAETPELHQDLDTDGENDEDLLLNQEGNTKENEEVAKQNVEVTDDASQHKKTMAIPSEWYAKWEPELAEMGYGYSRIIPPNRAVQLVLGCIVRPEVHKYLLKKEAYLDENEISVITFLGINGMFDLVYKLNAAGDNLVAYMNLVDKIYKALPGIHEEADKAEVRDVLTFIRCSTALEKANEFKCTNPRMKNKKKKVPKETPKEPEPVKLSTCLFDFCMLPEEKKQELMKEEPKAPAQKDVQQEMALLEEYNVKALTLTNCSTCPVMSNRLVELHAVKVKHALWETKNLGILAPLSAETWKSMCNITDREVECAYDDAACFNRTIGKEQVNLPVKSTLFFGKKCTFNNGIWLGQKGHMLSTKEKREPFYIVKLWRTFCPFLKCKCDKFDKKQETGCDDNITWYDHAVWYMLNNTHILWPGQSCTRRFCLFFSMMNSKPMRKGGIAFLAYLKVRETLIDMTTRMAENKFTDFQDVFGDTTLVDVLERTIKIKSFSDGKPPLDVNGKVYKGYNKRKVQVIDEEDIMVIMPPKRKAKVAGETTPAANKMDLISISDDAPKVGVDTERSVGSELIGHNRTEGLVPTKMAF